MANPVKGEAQLGEFTLAFNFGAFCALEEKTRMKVPQLLGAMADGLGFCELRDFVWAGLQTHQPEATEQTASDLIEKMGYEKSGTAVGRAVSGYFGAAKAKDKNPPKAG